MDAVQVCPYCDLMFPHQAPTGCPPTSEWAERKKAETKEFVLEIYFDVQVGEEPTENVSQTKIDAWYGRRNELVENVIEEFKKYGFAHLPKTDINWRDIDD